MIRTGTIKIHDVLPYVIFENKIVGSMGAHQKRKYLGKSVSMVSDRLKTFARHGISCVACGIEGLFFAVEAHQNDISCHLNLYATDNDSQEILMTKDHIMPISKGGKNQLINYQTMCSPCNQKKDNTIKREN